MIRILGANRFPVRVFWSCVGLAGTAVIVPHWMVAPIVAGGALWISAYAVRDEVRRMQLSAWERRR